MSGPDDLPESYPFGPAGGGQAEGRERQGGAIMSLGQHLGELRRRVLTCVIAVAAGFILCVAFRDRLWAVLVKPHVDVMEAFGLDPRLKFSSYLEVVLVQLKACAACGIVLAAPVLIYQAWAFVAPALYARERRKILRVGAACLACLIAGVGLGYFFFVPLVLRCLISLSGAWADPVLMVGSYFSTLLMLTLVLGLAFQTPVVVYFLIRWHILEPAALQRHRKVVVLGAFIVSAVITPTVDPVTQTVVAAVLIVLYDLGGLAAAPSVATVMGFLKFTGALALVAVAFGAWYALWPVGEVRALRGTVTLDGRPVAPGPAVRFTRGALCETGADGAARLTLSGRHGLAAYIAEDTRLQAHGPDSLSLYRGAGLLENTEANSEAAANAGPAKVTLTRARAELRVPRQDAATVTVFEGLALVKSGGQERRITAGQTATFYAGGEPADMSAAEGRWRDLIQGK